MIDLEKNMVYMGFSDECIKEMLEFNISMSEYQEYIKIFSDNFNFFLRKFESKKDKEKLLLYLYICFAIDFKDELIKKIRMKISNLVNENLNVEQIYYDTISDILIWQKVYKRRSGKIGLIEEEWVAKSLKLELYRFGRLQFEPDINRKVIHIHIPEGEKLDFNLCINSLDIAKKVFYDYKYFDCLSWLLSPNILSIIDSSTNIYKFQKLFKIVDIKFDEKQASKRILEDDIYSNHRKSSLQLRFIEYIKNNTDPGMGYGIIKI